MEIEGVFDLADRGVKRDLQATIGSLHGPHEIKIRKRFRGRTLNQNAWYHACVVPALQSGIREQWGQPKSHDEAHEMLKGRFLSQSVRHKDEQTGEVFELVWVRSTTSLDTQEFSDYCDECCKFIAEWFGISVPTPGQY